MPRGPIVVTLVVATFLACSKGEKPLATFGESVFTAADYQDELGYLLEPGQTLSDVGLTPEGFLRRVVRLRLLLAESERRVPTLPPSAASRLAAYQEMLFREEMAKEAYPDVPVPEEEIRARYERVRQEEREIVHFVGTPSAVAAVTRGVAGGAPFDSAAMRALRDDPKGGRLTPLGFHTRGKLPGAWEAAAWKLAPGQTSEPFTTAQGTHLVHCVSTRETPYESVRESILTSIMSERSMQRMSDMENDLLQSARFSRDSTVVDQLAAIVRAHRDSADAAGADPSTVRFPALPAELRDKPLFTVFDSPYPTAALASELSGIPLSAWTHAAEREDLERLIRRRAIAAIVDRAARTRGYYERPDLVAAIEQKRRELVMNTLLTELWRGVTVTEEEIRAYLAQQGQDIPGAEGMDLLVQRIKRQREGERLEAYLDTLSIQSDVQYYPERLSLLGDRAFTYVPNAAAPEKS